MEKKPQSYDEWRFKVGWAGDLGIRMLITHRLLQQASNEIVGRLFEMGRSAFERAIFERGVQPKSIEFNVENDVSLRAQEISILISVEHGVSLQQYAGVAYSDARDFYHQVKQWENKSLWGYIGWWLKRKMPTKLSGGIWWGKHDA